MTISNETKIGALTAVAITLLILGFNFLKGKNITAKGTKYVSVFQNIQGLSVSNPVVINGKEVGSISATDGGRDMRNIKVFMSMKEDVDIPDNSYTTISKSLLGVVQLEINLGNSKRFIKDGDTISARNPSDMIDEAMKKLEPVLTSVAKAANSLDKLLIQAATVFDEGSKNNIKEMLASLNQTASNLKTISSSLESSLDAKNGTLAKTFDNLQSVTGNLKNSNQDISKTLHNLELTTGKFSRMDLEKTLLNLNDAVASLKSTLEKANDTKGSLGLLLNDPALYKNLSATSNKINVLLDDVRTNPRRYVNVSVFGKKNKTQPLQVPMPDTLNAPYLKK